MEDGHIRVSNDERARVAATLSEAAGKGLLTLDEADERMSAAYAAKTRGDLSVLTADLPPEPAPMPVAVGPVAAPARDRAWLLPVAFVALLVLMIAVGVLTHGHVWFPWPLFVIWFVVAGKARRGHRRHHHVHVHHHHRDRHDPWATPRM